MYVYTIILYNTNSLLLHPPAVGGVTGGMVLLLCCSICTGFYVRNRRAQSTSLHPQTTIQHPPQRTVQHPRTTFDLEIRGLSQTNQIDSTTPPNQFPTDECSSRDNIIDDLSKSKLQTLPPPTYSEVIATGTYDVPIYDGQKTT